MTIIRCFEMFAGYGGASFSLKKAGIEYETVGFSEIYEPGIKIFKQNHGDIKNYGDCTKIIPEELPNFDLLTGGFPCQPFSVNTHKDARGKKHKSYNLFMDIIRILKVKKPTYILLENVKGILGIKSKEVLENLLIELSKLGYDVYMKTLNSKKYGSPQNRERVFFVGKLGGWKENEFEWPKEHEFRLKLREYIDFDSERREPRLKKMKLNKECNIQKYGKISRYEALLKSPVVKRDSNVVFEIKDAPSNVVSRQSDRIYNLTFSPCLTATGTDYVFWDGEKILVLTPKECFRIMGFYNDEIDISGFSDNHLHHLSGNGWDINVVSQIFKKMFYGDTR